MIILDTNLISELMRPQPDPRVLTWALTGEADHWYGELVCHCERLARPIATADLGLQWIDPWMPS